ARSATSMHRAGSRAMCGRNTVSCVSKGGSCRSGYSEKKKIRAFNSIITMWMATSSILIHIMLNHKSSIMVRIALFLVVSTLLTGVQKGLYAQHPTSPNIVFILADDLGWSSLSIPMDKADPQSASDYHETPNLNRLAAAGMRFSQAYAS